jgi:NAD(P)-dependent dehydrogenase (short-subunit alcohol dehydrogenase family)
LSRGSSGLGKELAKQLYQEGFNIILVSKNETKLTETKEEILLEELIPLPVSTASTNNNKNSKSNSTMESITAPVVIPKRNNDIQTITCDLENSFSPFLLFKELKKRNLESKVSFYFLYFVC